MKRYQIFISSTYTDLIEERSAVVESILKLRHIPVGMESFVATSDEQFNYIKRVMDETDYYVLIIGNRYGTITDDGLSYTEKEFDYAIERGLPILVFIHSDPDSIAIGKSECTQKSRKKLESFKNKVKKNRLVSLCNWNTPDKLATEVSIALSNAIHDISRPGWIRGECSEEDNYISDNQDIFFDKIKIKSEWNNNIEVIFNVLDDSIVRKVLYKKKIVFTWNELFKIWAQFLLEKNNKWKLMYLAGDLVLNSNLIKINENETCILSEESFYFITTQFVSCEFIEITHYVYNEEDGVAINRSEYILTEKGKLYLKVLLTE